MTSRSIIVLSATMFIVSLVCVSSTTVTRFTYIHHRHHHLQIYTPCLKKVPPLTSCSLDTHDPITTIFDRIVTEKVRNQMMLRFPTSSFCCFRMTLRNRKPRRQRSCMWYACNTVQLLQRSRVPFSCTMPPTAPELTHWLQDLGCHIAA